MVHLSENTSVVSKSSSDWWNYRGFPRDVCVALYNVPPGNKYAVIPNPSWKKKAVVFTNVTANAYQGQLNARFSKVCETFKVRSLESLKYIREFHTPVCYCGNIPNTGTWRWTKQTVIGCLTCRSNGLMSGPWSINTAIYSRSSVVSLKVWIRETRVYPAGMANNIKSFFKTNTCFTPCVDGDSNFTN